MNRDPSLHIKHSDLMKVLSKLKVTAPNQFAQNLLRECYKYRLTNRSYVSAGYKARKQIQRAVNAGTITPELFNKILSEERLQANHKGIRDIRKSSPEYLMLCEIAQLAFDFAGAYDLETKEGIRRYCRIAIKLMGKTYALSKFKTWNEKIALRYETEKAVEDDKDPEGTEGFHGAYCDLLFQYAGVKANFNKEDRYAFMVYGRMEADEVNAYYDEWIKAQFEGLSFLNVIPNPNQLFGENAYRRYEDYKLKAHVRSREGRKMTAEEREYFERVREKGE